MGDRPALDNGIKDKLIAD